MGKNHIISPYPENIKENYAEKEAVPSVHVNNNTSKTDSIIPPETLCNRNDEKYRIFILFILDHTYSMSVIYPALYRRICNEINELKKIRADIYLKLILFDDSGCSTSGYIKNTDIFINDTLLDIQFFGGNNNGYEIYLNTALENAIKDTEQLYDSDIKCIVMLTDSNASKENIPEGSFSDIPVDLVYLFVSDPAENNFIDINNMSIRNLSDFLNSRETILYMDIMDIIKYMEKKI